MYCFIKPINWEPKFSENEKNSKNERGNTPLSTVFVIKMFICKQKATLTMM